MEAKIFSIDRQKVDLTELELSGPTLDIGGGGEGIIGQIKKEELLVIDKREDELQEAPSGGIKMIMDAKDMGFLNNSFAGATSFFTLMYIPAEEHPGVFSEIYRVLKPGGHFWVWDVKMPKRGNREENVFVVPLLVELGEKTVETGYGVLWDKEQNLEYFLELGEKTGFQIVEKRETGETFFLKLRKRKE